MGDVKVIVTVEYEGTVISRGYEFMPFPGNEDWSTSKKVFNGIIQAAKEINNMIRATETPKENKEAGQA